MPVTNPNIQIRHMLLTWGTTTLTLEEALAVWRPELDRFIASIAPVDWVYQVEAPNSDEEGAQPFIHFQVYLHLSQKMRPATLQANWKAFSSFHRSHAIGYISAVNKKSAAFDYCLKEESRIKGPWAKDMVKLAGKLEGQARLKRFKARSAVLESSVEQAEWKGWKLTPYQRKVRAMIQDPIPCTRTILWFVSTLFAASHASFVGGSLRLLLHLYPPCEPTDGYSLACGSFAW
jgi:hypothetical protein